MSYMEDQARILEGQRAQRVGDSERGVTVGDMKRALVDDSYAEGNDIRRGLEIRGDAAPTPQPMESVDPGWSSFVEGEQVMEALDADAWERAEALGEEATLQRSINVVHEAEDDWGEPDDRAILEASLDVLAVAPARAAEFFEVLEERHGDEYVRQVLSVAGVTLEQLGQNAQAHEFNDQMWDSEMANVEHAQGSISALQQVSGLTPNQFEMIAGAFESATGTPLRQQLLAVMPDERATFLHELRVAHEVDQRAERERAFKASLFTPDTSVAAGLRGAGIEPPDMPPVLFDEEYHRYRVEQQVRREAAERVTRPTETQDADSIKRGLLSEEYSGRWQDGLTDSDGRRTSVREISERDPDSIVNQQARQRERDAWKLANLTGGRLQR